MVLVPVFPGSDGVAVFAGVGVKREAAAVGLFLLEKAFGRPGVEIHFAKNTKQIGREMDAGQVESPALLWNRVDIRTAVGTAAACGLPIAMGGAAGFAMASMSAGSPQGLSTGFIYWPAVAGIVLASFPMAPVGARLAHHLPRTTLQRVFALLLVIVGVKMLLGV